MFGSKDQREVTLSLASGGHRMMITTKVQHKCPEAGPGPTKVTAAVTGTVYKVRRTRTGGFQEDTVGRTLGLSTAVRAHLGCAGEGVRKEERQHS